MDALEVAVMSEEVALAGVVVAGIIGAEVVADTVPESDALEEAMSAWICPRSAVSWDCRLAIKELFSSAEVGREPLSSDARVRGPTNPETGEMPFACWYFITAAFVSDPK